jgi:DNA-binding HxlR family transcriptional regulator
LIASTTHFLTFGGLVNFPHIYLGVLDECNLSPPRVVVGDLANRTPFASSSLHSLSSSRQHEQVVQEKFAPFRIEFESCPVQASLGILGRKYALLIIRDIGLFGKHRFNEMLMVTPGLTKRVLSIRLKELEKGGFIEVVERGRNNSKWDLTEKGRDTLPILMSLVQFGSKHYADRVFVDQKPRVLNEIFEDSYIQKIMGKLIIDIPVRTYKQISKYQQTIFVLENMSLYLFRGESTKA